MSVTDPQPSWASKFGIATLPTEPADLGAIPAAEWAAIHDLISRYAWAYDERQIAVLGAVFADDAVWEGNVAAQVPIEPLTGRSAIVEWLQGHMAGQTAQRRHNVLNVTATKAESGRATVQTYLLLTAVENGRIVVVTTGVYVIDVEKQASGWVITHLNAGFEIPF